MRSGYPRFFIHPSIQQFADTLAQSFGAEGQTIFLFPDALTALQCLQFVRGRTGQPSSDGLGSVPSNGHSFQVLEFIIPKVGQGEPANVEVLPDVVLAAALIPEIFFSVGKQFWQHSGEGISSRHAEFLQQAFHAGYLLLRNREGTSEDRGRAMKGPKRYQKDSLFVRGSPMQDVSSVPSDGINYAQFVEERFGRNLDASLAQQAKLAIRKRIAGSISVSAPSEQWSTSSTKPGMETILQSEHDIYLYPSGMSSIFNSHQLLMKVRGAKKSIMFGFPYIDTLKILEKFGPGALFYGQGSSEDLDDLDARCSRGEEFLALYCEFPGNPLLKTPDLGRIRRLADRYDFAVVVDETIGNFLNVHVLPATDIVVSSLTKVFSGDSNVMGGSLTLNPNGRYYRVLKSSIQADYRDNYWPEDAIFMERNSRDFVSRNKRINRNAEALCMLLQKSSIVKQVYYPQLSTSKAHYDTFRKPTGGYGGLFSVTFHVPEDAHVFFDMLESEKGPSLGTNFTLSCPFVILAHYQELDWAAQFGAEADLVRVSVGLEDTTTLLNTFQHALGIAEMHSEEKQRTAAVGLWAI